MAIFSKEEREKLLSDSIGIISTYFRKSKKNLKEYEIKIENVDFGHKELRRFIKTLRLLYVISSIDLFKNIFLKIDRRPSKERKRQITNFYGEIQGNLNINEYIKQKNITKSPKEYPCDIYIEDHYLPENILFAYVIYSLYDELVSLEIPKGTIQKKIVDETLDFLHRRIYSSRLKHSMKKALNIFGSSNSDSIINNIIEEVKLRFRRKLIFNKAYMSLIEFYNKYTKRSFIQTHTINTLKLYDESFDDKLFEIWLLDKIGKCFEKEYNFRLKNEEISLMNRLKEPVIELYVPNKKKLKLYFQKSCGLVWGKNNDLDQEFQTTWNKYNADKNDDDKLKGYLDIIITYDDAKTYPPIMIDAKNILYRNNSNVSEKIYKMIGHLDNFKDFTEKYNGRRGILIFRKKENDLSEDFEELYYSSDGGTITIFSINPFFDSYRNKIKAICKNILEEIGYLNGAIEIKKDIDNINVGNGSIFENLKKASILNNEEKEDKIAVEIHEILYYSVYHRFKGNDKICEYEGILRENHFGNLWEKIPNNAKEFISIAEFLYNKVELLECSSAGVMYCKFIEKLANELIIMPFFTNYLKTKNYSIIKNYNNWELLFKREQRGQAISLEIGKLSRELKDVNSNLRDNLHNRSKMEFSNYINLLKNIQGEFKKKNRDQLGFWYENIRADEKKTKEINNLGNNIFRFSKIRNKIAHVDKVNRNDLVVCRKKVLGIGCEDSIALKIINLFG